MKKAAYWTALAFLISANGTILNLDSDVFTSLTRVFAVPAIVCWFIRLISEKRVRQLHAFHWLFIAFILWSATSALWSYSVDFTVDGLQRYANYWIALIVFWDAFRDEKQIEGAMQAFVIGGYVTVMGTIVSYIHGDAAITAQDRYSSFEFHPDDVGLIVGISMPLAWYLGHSSKHLSPWWRPLNFVYPFAAVAAIILSGTRGAIVAAVPALIYMLFSLRKFPIRWRIVVGLMAVLAVGVIAKMGVHEQLDRIASITSSMGGDSGGDRMNGRLDVWGAGWDVFTKNPFLGVGSGAFPIATLPYGLPKSDSHVGIIAHNTYLSVLSETGIVGFIIFMSCLVTVLMSIRRCHAALRPALYAALGVWVIGASNLSFEGRWQTWLLFSLIVGVAYCVPTPAKLAPAWARQRAIDAAGPAGRNAEERRIA